MSVANTWHIAKNVQKRQRRRIKQMRMRMVMRKWTRKKWKIKRKIKRKTKRTRTTTCRSWMGKAMIQKVIQISMLMLIMTMKRMVMQLILM